MPKTGAQSFLQYQNHTIYYTHTTPKNIQTKKTRSNNCYFNYVTRYVILKRQNPRKIVSVCIPIFGMMVVSEIKTQNQ